MQIQAGHRYLNRAGAAVRIVQIVRSDHQMRDPTTWEPLGNACLVLCEIERFAEGGEPGNGQRYAVQHSGFYLPIGEHELDLIREVQPMEIA